jgi:oxalate decarboxylase/phosphoglucose isomerase-like protein (cupin superfamily)
MKNSFDTTPSDAALRAEDGWVDMDVRWLLTSDTVGAEHSVFGITVFTPGSKHDIHRHPNAEEFEYLVSGHGIARVGDADVELGPERSSSFRRTITTGSRTPATSPST